jgi:hypothetical protein
MLFFVVLAALFSMSSMSAAAQTPPPAVRTVVKGPMSGVDAPRQAAVRSAAEWSALWKTHDPGGPMPAIDFSREMVVGVFLGSRPTAGFGVEIVRAVGNSGTLVVEYVESAPSRDAITAQILTAPYHLAAIPKHDGEVRFQKVVK